MKRKINAIVSIVFSLIMLLSVSVTSFADDSGKLLYTDIEAFTDEEQEVVSDYLFQKSQEVDCDIVCLCIGSFETYENGKYTLDTIDDIAKDYYTENKIGRGVNGDAVIAVWVDDASPKSEGFKISVFGEKYSEEQVNYIYTETISDYINNVSGSDNSDYYLRCMAFADGFKIVADGQEYVTEVDDEGKISYYHKDEYKDSFNWLEYIAIAVVIGAVIGFIIATVMKSGLKSVIRQSGASGYVVADSFKVEKSNDVFLYKKVDKTPIPKQEPPKK